MTSGNSMIDTLRDFVTRVDALGIEYMVTGSFAMSAYGEIRFTRDVDVVVQLTRDAVPDFVQAFEHDHYLSDASVERAIAYRSMFNIVNLVHGGKIDCIVIKDTDFARVSFGRRYRGKVGDLEFWNTTKEDLIIAKLNWAHDSRSEMQIRDIALLTSTEYDAPYVAKWVERLRLQEMWAEVEQWKIHRKKSES